MDGEKKLTRKDTKAIFAYSSNIAKQKMAGGVFIRGDIVNSEKVTHCAKILHGVLCTISDESGVVKNLPLKKIGALCNMNETTIKRCIDELTKIHEMKTVRQGGPWHASAYIVRKARPTTQEA